MNHFFQRIKAKSIDHGQRPVLIAAFGDSVTEGSMEHGIWAPKSTFHYFSQELLEQFFPGSTFSTINSGFAGDTATRSLARLERDVIQYQPDLVYIAFGLNDSLEGEHGKEPFKSSLQKIIHIIRDKTEADVMLLTPPWMAQSTSFRIHPAHQDFAQTIIHTQTQGMVAEYANIIRTVALDENALLADVHKEWTRLNEEGFPTDQWLTNGLNHPCRDGHRLAALVVFNALMRMFIRIDGDFPFGTVLGHH